MDDSQPQGPAVDRRHLLRTGALLGGVATATAAAALTGTGTAQAADGEKVTLGATNTSSTTTAVRVGGSPGSTAPALQLSNAKGPSLYLEPVEDSSTDLRNGELRMLSYGLELGVDGVETTSELVLTETDLEFQPFLYPTDPFRLVDTRKNWQNKIIGSSPQAFDGAHRLRGGSWMDVLLYDVDDPIFAVMLNLHTVKPDKSGYLSVYSENNSPPDGSSLDFQAKVTTSGATFCGVRYVDIGTEDHNAIRVYTSATTHIVIDYLALAPAPDYSGDLAAAKQNPRLRRRRQRQAKAVAAMKAKLARG